MARSNADQRLGDLVTRPESLPRNGGVRIRRGEPLSVDDDYSIGDSLNALNALNALESAENHVIGADVLRDALLRHAVIHPREKADGRIRYLDFYFAHRAEIANLSLPARVGYGAACFDAFAVSFGLRDDGVETISNVLWSFLIPEQRASWREAAQFQIPPTHAGFRALFREAHADGIIASLEEIVDWVVDAGSSAIEHGAADFGSIAATIGAMHVVARCGVRLPELAPFKASALTEGNGWERDVSIHLRERAIAGTPFRG